MKTGIRTAVAAAAVLAMALLASPSAKAQPLNDIVKVNMPYAVSLGEKTLPPGDYEIRQLRDLGGGSRVLLIYSDRGMKFEAMAMTIPTLDLKTPEDTKVILSHIGNDYYFDKIWVQGKNYGYEFVLPKRVRERATEVVATNATTTTSSSTETTVASNESTESRVRVKTEEEYVAPKPVEAEPIPEPTPEPEATPTPTPVPDSSADRSAEEQPDNSSSANRETMPKTNSGWLALLLGSGSLFGAGLALRRKH